MDMIKIAAAAVIGVFLALLVKGQKPKYGIMLTLGVGILIFLSAMGQMSVMISGIREIMKNLSLEGDYVVTILKMIGITYLAEFAGNICRDAGYASIAGQLEIFAKLSILTLSMPILFSFLHTIGEFL